MDFVEKYINQVINNYFFIKKDTNRKETYQDGNVN